MSAKPVKESVSLGLVEIFFPLFLYSKTFGTMTFTVKKSNLKNAPLTSSITKLDYFIILFRIIISSIFIVLNILVGVSSDLEKTIILIMSGIRFIACSSLIYNILAAILELHFRKKMVKIMNDMIEFDNEVT